MGVDITPEFRNFAKKNVATDRSILRPIRRADPFTQSAFEVSEHIRQSKAFIEGQKNRYIIPGMATDLERDQIEKEMISFIRTCSASVEHLSQLVQQNQNAMESEQAIAHRHGMVLIISEELKDLTLLLDHYRSEHARQVKNLQERRRKQQERMKTQISSQVPDSSQSGPSYFSQEQEVIQEENKALFEELSTLSDRVIETERMMVEISTLNQMLCSQIMSQSEQIEQVYNDAIYSSENLNRGNVHLQKAMETNSSTRKYILIIMILAAVILLFFDRFYS